MSADSGSLAVKKGGQGKSGLLKKQKSAPTPTATAPTAPDGHADNADIETTRVIRDTDFNAGSYDSDTGEFVPSVAQMDYFQKRVDSDRAKARQQRQAADTWVKTALAATGH